MWWFAEQGRERGNEGCFPGALDAVEADEEWLVRILRGGLVKGELPQDKRDTVGGFVVDYLRFGFRVRGRGYAGIGDGIFRGRAGGHFGGCADPLKGAMAR